MLRINPGYTLGKHFKIRIFHLSMTNHFKTTEWLEIDIGIIIATFIGNIMGLITFPSCCQYMVFNG